MNDKNACLGSLKMQYCNSLIFIVRGKLPSSLKKLEIERCEKLEYLWDDNEESCTSVVDEENPNNTNTSLLEYLDVNKCPSLKCLSSSGLLPETLQHLNIEDCSQLTMLSSSGHLPQMLRTLSLDTLPEIESIAERFHNNKSLEEISVKYCRNLKSVPEGLHNLIHLRKIEIYNCESIDCLGEEGSPNLSELAIGCCEKLKALPNWFHSLNSLKSLTLKGCPSMTSFPEEGFPTNLTSLYTEGLNVKMCKALLEWGLHNLNSLKSLEICTSLLRSPECSVLLRRSGSTINPEKPSSAQNRLRAQGSSSDHTRKKTERLLFDSRLVIGIEGERSLLDDLFILLMGLTKLKMQCYWKHQISVSDPNFRIYITDVAPSLYNLVETLLNRLRYSCGLEPLNFMFFWKYARVQHTFCASMLVCGGLGNSKDPTRNEHLSEDSSILIKAEETVIECNSTLETSKFAPLWVRSPALIGLLEDDFCSSTEITEGKIMLKMIKPEVALKDERTSN
ncbi:hypothetical protein EZV62_009301 [Acer yangbiense]|uniref:Uncharacterized protein n=1 Tax=Acer yangbiense TaxID=1000413 RepID=A0A5C7IHS6_9ROSI|nr:hypothetical protein EZV62_009301 [Acer yangbiense]